MSYIGGRPTRRCPRLRRLLWVVLLCAPWWLSAATPPSAEYKLKAALIYKLSKFVEWPSLHVTGPGMEFRICLLGRDDFGSALDALSGRRTAGLPIAIRRFSQSESIGNDCHMLFISDSKQPFMRSILRSLAQRPILTVGDSEHFARNGGMIQFTREDKRLGFKINLEQARASHLKIAAPLLELATIVHTGTAEQTP